MALNPIAYTENVVRSFLRYQLTAYPFADPHLHGQMRALLSLDETRRSPLLKGPYVSLSRPFRQGAPVASLVKEGLLHPHLGERIPSDITHLYSHQERAIRAISEGRTTLVSTGTGSGKTECFLYPIISRCLTLRDEEVPPGISAVIVYPMNALAEDQLMRLRGVLAGTGIPFGIYVGKTPERETDVVGVRLRAGSSRADYEARLGRARREGSGESVYPGEEVCSREVMRTPGGQPRILLTNVKQLELLLTRQQDIELFTGARLDYLVFDEAHTFTGALGSETACLIRRLRAFCGADVDTRAQRDPNGAGRARRVPSGTHTTCVATSATIVDRQDPQAAKHFASRFFGVAPEEVVTVGEDYEAEVWAAAPRSVPPAPAEDPADILERCVRAVENEDGSGAAVRAVWRSLRGEELGEGDWPETLHGALSRNELVFRLNEELHSPRALDELPGVLEQHVDRPGRGSRNPRLARPWSRRTPRRAPAASPGPARVRARHRRRGGNVPGGRERRPSVACRRRRRPSRRAWRGPRAFSGDDVHHLRTALLHRVPRGLRLHRQTAGRGPGRLGRPLVAVSGGNARRQACRAVRSPDRRERR